VSLEVQIYVEIVLKNEVDSLLFLGV